MGVTEKIGAATNSRKNYKQKIQNKTGGDLICKNFGVNGNVVTFRGATAHFQPDLPLGPDPLQTPPPQT